MKETAQALLERIFRLAHEHVTELKAKADRVDAKTGTLNGYTATDARTLQDYAKICFLAIKDETPTEQIDNLTDEELIQAAQAILKEQDNVDNPTQ